MIDLSGGQPDLVPEWVPWMMRDLKEAGLDRTVFLWSDDNLSNDYFWTYLSDADRELICDYEMYGRVCCFKGYDAEAFAFNTRAASEIYPRQFELMRRLMSLGIDLYAYVTLTGPRRESIQESVPRFVDSLQAIDENLPLRTVPLEVGVFTPVEKRLTPERRESLVIQHHALDAWRRELESRFASDARAQSICDVPLRTRQ